MTTTTRHINQPTWMFEENGSYFKMDVSYGTEEHGTSVTMRWYKDLTLVHDGQTWQLIEVTGDGPGTPLVSTYVKSKLVDKGDDLFTMLHRGHAYARNLQRSLDEAAA
jgi:hypothetical protein